MTKEKWVFPGSDGKESAYNERDPDSIPEWERSSGEGNGNLLQYSCLENSMDRESLVGYNPWDCEQSNTIYFVFFSVRPNLATKPPPKRNSSFALMRKGLFLYPFHRCID